MDTATLAMTLAVLQEGSVRGAGRLLGRAPSSVADAFERFERDLAMTLAQRSEGGLSLNLAGEALAGSSSSLMAGLKALAAVAKAPNDRLLHWTAHHAIPVATLAHFNAVVDAGSIRRAARVLGLGQPHLSRQMSRLDTIFEGVLLQRTSLGCEPTAQGLRLNEAARALVSEVAALTAPAKNRFARNMRTVKLGTIVPIGHESRLAGRLARLVSDWRRDKAGQDLLVSSTTAEDLMAGLRAGRFDIALMDTPMRHKRFESLEIFSSELVLVGPKQIIAQAGAIPSLLASHPIAVPSLRSGLRQRIREILEPWLAQAETAGSRLVEVDALPIIINLVLDHGYFTVLPLDAIMSLDREIGIVPLPDAPRLGFHLVWPRAGAARTIARAIEASLAPG